jgi:hypothetical protein
MASVVYCFVYILYESKIVRMSTVIPQYVKPTLWSYDIASMSLSRDSHRIITNVLNYGSLKAVKWLQAHYTALEIISVVEQARKGEWNNKSLTYWRAVYETTKDE